MDKLLYTIFLQPIFNNVYSQALLAVAKTQGLCFLLAWLAELGVFRHFKPCISGVWSPYEYSKFLYIIGNKMTLVQLSGQHRGKYVVYDDKGKIVIVTRNKNIALHYEQTTKTAA